MISFGSEKAQTTTLEDVHDRNASNEAHNSTSDENDDALNLFHNGSLINELSEPEDELNNDELLTQITTSLKDYQLLTDKFQL